MVSREKVLAHQLTGLAFHADCACLYESKGMTREKRTHYRQYVEECKTHIYTRILLCGDKYVEPGKMERIEVDSVENIPSLWKSWEQDTLSMYKELQKAEPENRLWQKLCRCVEKELRCLHGVSVADKMQTNAVEKVAESTETLED